jgi:hypothetical protein
VGGDVFRFLDSGVFVATGLQDDWVRGTKARDVSYFDGGAVLWREVCVEATPRWIL